MTKYLVRICEQETEIEEVLNSCSADGWNFHSMETEYTHFILIFTKDSLMRDADGVNIDPEAYMNKLYSSLGP